MTPPDLAPTGTQPVSHARYLWAVLIARIHEVLPLICPDCGQDMRLMALAWFKKGRFRVTPA